MVKDYSRIVRTVLSQKWSGLLEGFYRPVPYNNTIYLWIGGKVPRPARLHMCGNCSLTHKDEFSINILSSLRPTNK